MTGYNESIGAFFAGFGPAKKMVLATSIADHVTARMMSVIQADSCFYFQTDKTFAKHEQLIADPLVALCIDNKPCRTFFDIAAQTCRKEFYCGE